MTTDPAPAPDLAPAVAPAGGEVAPHDRPRLRLTAVFGFLASILFLVAWFLPWIEVPPERRATAREALERDRASLGREDPETSEMVKVLIEDLTEKGNLTGLGLFHYLRTGRAVSRHYVGDDAGAAAESRPIRIRRAFLVGAILLAALPVVCLLLALYFLTHRFRRVRSPILIVMALVGCGAAALAISWLRFSEILGFDVLTGVGVRLSGAAAIVLALGGIFGVTGRNWWRVYAGFLATLAGLAVIAWAYVSGGTPR